MQESKVLWVLIFKRNRVVVTMRKETHVVTVPVPDVNVLSLLEEIIQNQVKLSFRNLLVIWLIFPGYYL